MLLFKGCVAILTTLFAFAWTEEAIEANNSPSSSIYDTSSSLTSLRWLPGGGGSPQYQPAESPDLVSSSSFAESAEDQLLGQEGSYRRKYRRKGTKKRNKNRKRNKYRYKDYTPSNTFSSSGIGSEDYYSENLDEDEYYDRDDGYGAPHAPSYSAPSSGYDAPSPSYSPSPSYGAPSYSGGDDGFNDFLNALAAFLPIGLFLAAIPPNLITISTKKKRSLTEENVETYDYPFLERINEIGFDHLVSEVSCQKRLFCEMAYRGGAEEGKLDANRVQKAFNAAVRLSPRFLSDLFGTTEVFEAAKDGNCSVFQC